MVTKKAKKVKIMWKEIKYTYYESEYQCPNCHTIFQNTLNKNVIRFICKCGQEIIVDK